MIPKFEFIRPKDLQEAIALLDRYREQGQARLIAGGTDIIPGFQQEAPRFKNIKVLIDLHGLEELKAIKRENNHVSIGAGVTFSQLSGHPLINEIFPLLAGAAGKVGSLQIRNRATIAGNFINNAPCADSAAPLLVYNAVLNIQSLHGSREVSLEDFLLKPYQTQLQPHELVSRIRIPVPGSHFRGEFYKLGRRRGVAISRISLALLADLHDSVIRELRIASGAITPIAKRFKSLEAEARGKVANRELFAYLARELGQQVLDLTGLRWSTEYKLPVMEQMFYQLLERVCNSRHSARKKASS
jgi:xanthine dehydrogenase FAD-binding subunit